MAPKEDFRKPFLVDDVINKDSAMPDMVIAIWKGQKPAAVN
jgi:hypothetical protein